MTKDYKVGMDNYPESEMLCLYKMMDRHERGKVTLPELKSALAFCGVNKEELSLDNLQVFIVYICNLYYDIIIYGYTYIYVSNNLFLWF
jgi:hypothetical protein